MPTLPRSRSNPFKELTLLGCLTAFHLAACQEGPGTGVGVRVQSLSAYPIIDSSNGLNLCDLSSAATATPKSTVLTAIGTFAPGATFEWTVLGCGGCTIATSNTLNVANNSVGEFSVRWVDPMTKVRSAYSPPLRISLRPCGTTPAPNHMADNNPSDAPATFSCKTETITPGEQLRRLTSKQYRNTLRDLFHYALAPNSAAADAAFIGIAPVLANVPASRKVTNPAADPRGGYSRMDQLINDTLVEEFYNVAQAAAAKLTENLGALAGPCATDLNAANDDQCVADFVQKFGSRALRRPLLSTEVTFYKDFYNPSVGISRAPFAAIISALLQAPDFLYMVENKGPVVNTNTLTLTPFELAARLSYHFWQTMPDEELWQAAMSGSLANDATYAAQVARLFGAPRTKESINEFYYDYLQIGEFLSGPALDRNNNDPAFRAFAGADLPDGTLANSMATEIQTMFDNLTATDAGYDALFTSSRNFMDPQYAALMRIYKLPNNGYTELSDRKGFLTRAMFLSTGSTITRPVQKGLFIRRAVLCDRVDPVPQVFETVAVEQRPSTNFTSRGKIEDLTGAEHCMYCHKRFNGLGFATENFDGLGRSRTVERLFSDSGQVVLSPLIATDSTPEVVPGDVASTSNGADDLAKLILDSGKGQACFARNYFRFSFGRWEDVDKDGCALEQLRQVLHNKGSLKSMLQSIALTPNFKRRSIQ